MRWWPRTIRWQMLVGLFLVEALSVGLFLTLMVGKQSQEIRRHVKSRLTYQVTALTTQLEQGSFGDKEWIDRAVVLMEGAPNVAIAKVTDPTGKVLAISPRDSNRVQLDPVEVAEISRTRHEQPLIFDEGGERWEAVRAIYVRGKLLGYGWVETEPEWDWEQLRTVLSGTFLFGAIWIGASVLLVFVMARAIARPLAVLRRGTQALVDLSETNAVFPLRNPSKNEIGDLIEVFNRMVASLLEQRRGLSDTLSQLDSMLANAPIGLAFVNSQARVVRVNHVFAELTGTELQRALGRSIVEVLPAEVADRVRDKILRTFQGEALAPNLEMTGRWGMPSRPGRMGEERTWLVSTYPVLTSPDRVNWVGVIILDATERKRSEGTLRKTERLATAGRLAASIAHEINNPLEAITNLFFVLRNFCQLEDPARTYIAQAEHELRRIGDITQQTLRFHRQSTLPGQANMSELLDSVLSLYQGRIHAHQIDVVRDFEPDLELFCFSGEIRQLIANLVANAIDASPKGGRLFVRARRSQGWVNRRQAGVRFTVADTGTGMAPEVRERIFEAFFTTKEDTGTGLGLWVSQEIVEKHKGSVRVRTRTQAGGKGSGTVFQVFIPDDPKLAHKLGGQPEAATQPIASR